MSDTITVKEAAMLWGITERRVTVLRKEGRIERAYKKGRSWQIPIFAEKPADSRIKNGAYRKKPNVAWFTASGWSFRLSSGLVRVLLCR